MPRVRVAHGLCHLRLRLKSLTPVAVEVSVQVQTKRTKNFVGTNLGVRHRGLHECLDPGELSEKGIGIKGENSVVKALALRRSQIGTVAHEPLDLADIGGKPSPIARF